MATTDAPKRPTGHPANDSGGGKSFSELVLFNQCRPRAWAYDDRYSFWSQWGEAFHLAPPLADYLRHWELEGPHA